VNDYKNHTGEKHKTKLKILYHLLSRLVDDERHALSLLDVVKTKNTDESVGVSLLSFTDFSQNLVRIGASEHGKLPHCPVTTIIVSGAGIINSLDGTILFEFEARDPVFLNHVVNFLSNGGVGQRGKIRQGFVFGVVVRRPHL
jgi:hypothetical protein